MRLVGTALSAAAAAVIAAVGVGAGAAIEASFDLVVATGMGYLPKAVEPERVLSPRQDGGVRGAGQLPGRERCTAGRGNRTLQIGNERTGASPPRRRPMTCCPCWPRCRRTGCFVDTWRSRAPRPTRPG